MKRRLDDLVVERGLVETKSKARAMILAGEITVGEKVVSKAGEQIREDAVIRLTHVGPRYVSRGGIKLAGALDHFRIDPKEWRCLDVGASTGGFSDCLLQRGAKQICTIDVGRGQLDHKLRNDPRVTWKESFHVNELTPKTFNIPFDLAVVDASFISLWKVLPFVIPCIRPGGCLIALIKPQFEAAKKDLSKGGVLKDEPKRQQIIQATVTFAQNTLKLLEVQTADAVIPGPKGNREVFLFAALR